MWYHPVTTAALAATFHWVVDTLDDHGGLVTAVATAVMAYYTFRLSRFTRAMSKGTDDTLEHLKRSAQIEARAYVACLDISGRAGHDGATILMRNSGRTPAHDLRLVVNGVHTERARLNSAVPFHVAFGQQVLGPGADFRADIILEVIPAFSPLEAAIRSISLADDCVCIWGSANYRDVFGNEWVTEFRWESTGSNLREKPLRFIPANDGNNAT